ncbi:MAG: hypothetical protein H0V07_13940, partial [Propionibacteriales bacterium]|nr:hypothetical protein [Propionibacteriales bacterium]
APAGQLWSSLGDLGRYAAFLADPDPGVLSPDTMREMATLQSGTPHTSPSHRQRTGSACTPSPAR